MNISRPMASVPHQSLQTLKAKAPQASHVQTTAPKFSGLPGAVLAASLVPALMSQSPVETKTMPVQHSDLLRPLTAQELAKDFKLSPSDIPIQNGDKLGALSVPEKASILFKDQEGRILKFSDDTMTTPVKSGKELKTRFFYVPSSQGPEYVKLKINLHNGKITTNWHNKLPD